jgi:hypothetical protein
LAQSTGAISAFDNVSLGRPAFTAQLQSTVVRENGGGTLDFYYQIINDNQFAIDPVETASLTNFSGFNIDADFRTDQGGVYAPSTALRDAAGGTVVFSWGSGFSFNYSFNADEETNALVIRTDATTFTDSGTMEIQFAGINTAEFPPVPAHGVIATYAPLPAVGAAVPEPASMGLLALAVGALAARIKFSRMR